MLAPKTYKYDPPIAPPRCVRDLKITAREQDSKIYLKGLIEQQLAKMILAHGDEYAKIQEQLGFKTPERAKA